MLAVADELPFQIARAFWVWGAGRDSRRGGHAHKACEQFVVAAHGSFSVLVERGEVREFFRLMSPEEGLYIPSMVWDEVFDFSADAVCLVLASHRYDPTDYIEDKEWFLAESKKGRVS